METVLLNPNSPTPKIPSQQSVATTEGEDSGGFSPAMDKAISALDKENGPKDSLTDDNADTDTDAFPNEDVLLLDSNISDHTSIITDDTAIATTGNLFAEIPNNNILQAQVPNQTFNSIAIEGMNGVAIEGMNGVAIEGMPTSANSQQVVSTPVIQAGTENNIPSATKAETLLLRQIQHILDQGKDTGSISINGNKLPATDPLRSAENLQNLSSPLLAEAQNSAIQAKQVGIIPPSIENTVHIIQNSTKVEGVQQDVTEQFYHAKLGDSKGHNSEGFQQGNNGQKGTEQQNKSEVEVEIQNTLNQTNGSTVSEGKPGDSAFGQQLSTSSITPTTTPISVEGKLAPGTHLPVPEKEMVNNLIQRFSVNPRLQTSKLTMQLNPAELGALKIDILVKGDSIKANIVAQSQQVLETLDKQMPRLRAVLQEQGFTVDSFVITLESDGGNKSELFQENFSSSQQEFTSSKSFTQKNDSFDILLDGQKETSETQEDTSGINLNA